MGTVSVGEAAACSTIERKEADSELDLADISGEHANCIMLAQVVTAVAVSS
jgi:hypothetical protein